MREKELRLALVCYGGVSLAVYMHGIVKEAWKLLRASRAFHDPKAPGKLNDSEQVYFDLLATMAPHVSLRVLVDIVAGASAGGINGVMLSHAIAGGHDLEPLRDLWLNNADVEKLLDPDAAPTSAWSKLYARPLAWLAGRDKAGDDVDRIADPAARAEVRAKLSRFVRSRWFEPPFSGAGFTRLLYEALEAMEHGERTPPLLPPDQPLDLFVTATDFYGYPEHLSLNSPASVEETEHRLVIGFRDDGHGGERRIADRAALAFAARATASFPGAFPPFQVAELDGVLDELGETWPGRDAFLASAFARRIAAGLDPADASLIDGSVLVNAPFRPAIDALRNRPAHREVDRRFVYIDPKPGGHLVSLPGVDPKQRPGFFTAILHSLSNIPREQPIRDNLDAIAGLSRRVRRLRYIIAGMRDEVDAAIEAALGRTLRFYRPTPRRLAEWRSRVQTAAAEQASYAYAAYGHLKLSQIVEHLADTLATIGGQRQAGRGERVRAALWRWVRDNQLDEVETRPGRGATSAYVAFLRRYDLLYRIRRLRFLIRRLTEIATDPPPGQDPRALDRLKEGLYALLAPLIERRDPTSFTEIEALASRAHDEPGAALQALGDAFDLTALDAVTDAGLIERLNAPDVQAPVRRALILAYLGFPFFDIATLPLLQGEGLDEFDEIKVDRLSPDDATSIRKGGAAATLKGIQFSGFGAFFSRAWRENDYLWGRLHAAERLIDIVLSTLPKGATLPEGTAADLKRRAFRAIVEVERQHLTHVPDLCDRLLREIG